MSEYIVTDPELADYLRLEQQCADAVRPLIEATMIDLDCRVLAEVRKGVDESETER